MHNISRMFSSVQIAVRLLWKIRPADVERGEAAERVERESEVLPRRPQHRRGARARDGRAARGPFGRIHVLDLMSKPNAPTEFDDSIRSLDYAESGHS